MAVKKKVKKPVITGSVVEEVVEVEPKSKARIRQEEANAENRAINARLRAKANTFVVGRDRTDFLRSNFTRIKSGVSSSEIEEEEVK